MANITSRTAQTLTELALNVLLPHSVSFLLFPPEVKSGSDYVKKSHKILFHVSFLNVEQICPFEFGSDCFPCNVDQITRQNQGTAKLQWA